MKYPDLLPRRMPTTLTSGHGLLHLSSESILFWFSKRSVWLHLTAFSSQPVHTSLHAALSRPQTTKALKRAITLTEQSPPHPELSLSFYFTALLLTLSTRHVLQPHLTVWELRRG